ncbi:MAG: virulence factor SrfB [Gammaproteobacteria bacterium]|nr:virulence factor SrfB [Gammaproteobacteria bacterium]
MLAKLKQYGPVISLVPETAIQFMDFGFNLDEIRVSRSFLNIPATADDPPDLVCLYPDSEGGPLRDGEGRIPVQQEQIYSVSGARALEPYLACWLPVPFLRVRERLPDGACHFAQGPGNWARVRVVELPAPDAQGNTHRVTLAFDTHLITAREGRPYLAPSPQDMQSGEEFGLTDAEADTHWFRTQEWVGEWLLQTFYAYEMRRRAPRRVDENEVRQGVEHIARYLTVLSLLAKAELFPRIRFVYVDSQTPARAQPVDVDLVLDIGNSRSCGILMETSGDDPVDLNDSYRLELRSLDQPEWVFDEPFPSRVEFARNQFGDDRWSRRSGRASAFLWPSPVRVGFEAQALSYYSHGTEGSTGLSTPKRYLWDIARRHHEWRFNRGADTQTHGGPVTVGPFIGYLREDGEERAPSDTPAMMALFSRSSLMSFFIGEVLLQAFVLINSPAKRYERAHADAPRRLRRVIFTLPTAMPLAERRLFAKRIRVAIRLTWQSLGLDEAQAPEPFLQWDEATGTQIVFLYNEIKHNFQGDAELLFKVFGRVRDSHGPQPVLRLASIDIGGGTSDLIITTYELEGGTALKPTQEFREGFNLAGDDILNNLVERNLFPSLLQAIHQAGVAEPDILLARLLGGNRGDQSEYERTLRRQFANQIALPLALRLLHRYEVADLKLGNEAITLRFADVFDARTWPHEQVIAYIQDAVRAAGGPDFQLAEVSFETTLIAIDTTVRRTIGQVLSDLCEVIYLYDCDYLLISGRPCRLPAVRSAILAKLPVLADRIITLHSYKVGNWYPFRAISGRLSDPKTTAVVGAMVCALAEGQLYKFHLRSRDLGMKSTARFVGQLEQTGRIKQENVLFANLELEDRKTRVPEATLDFYAPVFIGFRQLNVERWPGTPLYRLNFAQPQDARRLQLPLKVVLERAIDEEGDEQDFRIIDTTDSNGNPVQRGAVVLKLQTLKDEEGYWLDTGIFSIPQ